MNRPKVILDARGLLVHMYHRGTDPDSILCEGTDKQANTAGWGFVNWLDEYILPLFERGYHATDIVAVWDGGNDYRTALFPAYKKKRREESAKKPKELTQQMKTLEEAGKAFLANIGAVNMQCPGVEADDLIAAVCAGLKGYPKIVYTVDADLLQLVDNTTHVYLRDQPYTEGVEYKGVPLNLIRMNKALVGDSSDGYGGVYRFGDKAWDKLVEEIGFDGISELEQCFQTGNFDTFDEAVGAAPDLKMLGHVHEKLSQAKLGHKLASLHPEICHQFRGNQLVWPKYYTRVPSKEKVENILLQMGCPDYMEKFEFLLPTETLMTDWNYNMLFSEMSDMFKQSPYISIDYESYDTLNYQPFREAVRGTGENYVDVLSQEITGMSVNYGPDLQRTIYVPMNHRDTYNFDPIVLVEILQMIKSAGKELVVHNASFEELVGKLNLDYQIVEPFDTVIMASYVNENDDRGLKSLSKRWLNYDQATYKETLEAAGASDMSELTGEQVLSYGCDDSLVTAHLAKVFWLVMKIENTWKFYEKNERAPVHVLNHAFETGVRLDFDKMSDLHGKADSIVELGMERIRQLLIENCKEPFTPLLDDADGANRIKVTRFRDGKAGKSRSDDAYLAKREEQKLKWEAATVYQPYTETYVPPDFLGTHTQLNIVAESLGWNLGTGEELGKYALPSNANVRINEWITLIRNSPDYWDDPENFVAMDTFLDLLAAATGTPLKKRQGPEFEALAEFCLPYMGEGKIVKEGDELNLNSPDQMQELLYCKLGLPVRNRTRPDKGSARDECGVEGSPSTNEEAMLVAIAEDCEGAEWKAEILDTVLKVKEQLTMISIYYRPYPMWIHPRDDMVHPVVKNCGTVTRRPSGNNPNILQVKKGETRTMYLPRYDDHVIVAIDFSGQELRITGSESKDPVLIDAYTGGGLVTDEDGMVHPVTKDIHSVTAISFAETIFQRELNSNDFQFTYDAFREMLTCDDPAVAAAANLCRKMAKTVNFLIIYGGQASTLAMRLRIPETFASEIMSNVFINYGRLEPWQEETIMLARQQGFIRTAYGSMKHLTSDIRSHDNSKRSRQERQAVNSAIQGCAADILKVVLTNSHRTNLWQETGAVMIAPVYDEVVSSVPRRNVFEYGQRMQDLMNITPPGHAIPMMAEVSVGPNWGDVVELGDRPSERKLIECMEKF